MYALFEKWNPGKDDIIKEDVAYWTGEKEYKIVVTEIGTVILAVEWEYDDNSNLTGLKAVLAGLMKTLSASGVRRATSNM